ncbi:MAG: hypothetical protein NVSMB9_24040 [Isosphaeraceae bacterium]
MRRPCWFPWAFSLLLLSRGLAPTLASAAETDLKGPWKLIMVGPFIEQDFLQFDISDRGGKLEARVNDFSRQFPQAPEVGRIEAKGNVVSFALKIASVEGLFKGEARKDGTITGQLTVNEQGIPSRLEKSKGEKLSPPPQGPPPLVQNYFSARSEKDPKTRVKKLREIVDKNPGSPTMAQVYADLLKDAETGGLTEPEVRKLVTEWFDGAKVYGQSYGAEVGSQALRTLAGKPAYARLSLSLAKKVDSTLSAEAPLQARADVAKALAESARLAGDKSLATSALEKATKLESQLDEEYHKKVPPFKPVASSKAKDRKSDRVVLMELFTGAQCPPCVAADVAFDALIDTYKPTELVTLQYHLHIPGPDPLTNADSVSRVAYYPDFQGTPTTFFDGKALAPGGGPMAGSKGKYDQYRTLIDDLLTRPSGARLDLKVDSKEDTIKIQASTQAKSDSSAKAGSKLMLRLALIEEQVRYTGGNALRFHHHVVRALPGGAEGKALSNGQATANVTVKLKDLRQGLEKYLSDYTKEGNSFKGLPPIELARLSVVAFVQDDNDKSILNAAMVPVASK